MGGFRRKTSWFSPRAIKEPTPRVVEEQIGPNSFRYVAVKEVNRLETPPMKMGLSYEEYRKQKDSKKKNKRDRNHSSTAWAEEAYGDEAAYGYYTGTSAFKSSTYSWEKSRWSNWSYGSFLKTATDDNEDMFVKEPESYLTPTIDQIKAKTHYWTVEDIKTIKELSRVCYLKMIDDTEYLHEDYEDENCGRISPEEYRKKKAMFDNVYTTFVPGFTPLEQAIAFNHKINDQKSKEAGLGPGQSRGGGSRTVIFNRSDYSDPYINRQMSLNRTSKKFNLDVLNMISLMRDLGHQFKVERSIGEREVGFSETTKPSLMTSYDQIRMIDTYQRMLRGYNIKFATKNLIVNVPVQSSEKKQKIIIMLDFSGSMSEGIKQIKVNSILIDRFRYVMKGEAEVFFSYFVSNTDFLKFHHIKNEKDVLRFWSWFSNSPNGSCTAIGRNIEYVADQIRRGRLHNLDIDLSKELPEILIINDGEDEVGYNTFSYKVNAISLMTFNPELKNLCVASGGKQVFIDEKGIITNYSSDGVEIISE